MRDIRGDLQERAARVQQQIDAEDARFEALLRQLKSERDKRLEPLKAQLQATNKVIGFAAWHHDVRTALLVGIAGAAAAELSVRKSLATLP